MRNTLIDINQQKCVITDFGLSREDTDTSKTSVIAPRWTSPELLRSRIPTKESDVWALGKQNCFSYWYRGLPIKPINEIEISFKKLGGKFVSLTEKNRT